MRWSAAFIPLTCVLAVFALPLNTTVFDRRAVSQDVFDNFVFYLQYASSAYGAACSKPNGNTLVKQINNRATDTQGFIVRDDNRKEIVVALRGSSSAQDFATDADTTLVPFQSPGVNPPAGALVHRGFLTAWNSVAADVMTTVKSQLAANPGFTLASSGHSLGGALSSLAGISLQQNFPNSTTRMFTFGQPRTGNAAYASFVNQEIGANAFRGVHTNDGVPTIIPQTLGYQHHGVEFFQNPDPATPATVKQCAADGEDPTCSDAIPSAGINKAHLTYFNIPLGTPFCN